MLRPSSLLIEEDSDPFRDLFSLQRWSPYIRSEDLQKYGVDIQSQQQLICRGLSIT